MYLLKRLSPVLNNPWKVLGSLGLCLLSCLTLALIASAISLIYVDNYTHTDGRNQSNPNITSSTNTPHLSTITSSSTSSTTQPVGSPTTPANHNPAWTEVSAWLANQINSSVDPCEDFYMFACGGFIETAERTGKANGWSSLNQMQESIDRRLSQAIYLIDPDTASASMKKLKISSEICGDQGWGLKNFAGEIRNFLVENFNGWPLLEGDHWAPKADFPSLLGRINKMMGVFPLIWPKVDVTDLIAESGNRKMELFIEPGEIINQRHEIQNGSQFCSIFTEIAEALSGGGPLQNGTAVAVERMWSIEQKLTKIISKFDLDVRNITNEYNVFYFNDFSSGNIEQLTDYWNWADYFYDILPDEAFVNYLVNPSTNPIILTHPNYITAIKEVLANYSEKELMNYILGLALFKLSDNFNLFSISNVSYFEKSSFIVDQNMYPSYPLSPSTSSCTIFLTQKMDMAIGQLFLNLYLITPTLETAVGDIVRNIATEIYFDIFGGQTFDEVTKPIAEKKVKDISVKAGYPYWIINDALLDEHYSELFVNDSMDWFELIIELNSWQYAQLFDQLTKPPDDARGTFRGISPAQIGTLTLQSFNAVILPAALALPPLFLLEGPKFANYGRIGWLIGRVMSKLFDPIGVQYNNHGLVTSDWLDNFTISAYHKIIDQLSIIYDGYCLEDGSEIFNFQECKICVKGQNSVRENFQDNYGLKYARAAYNRWLIQNGPEMELKNFENFTNEQLFLILSASTMCEASSKDWEQHQIQINEVPAQFRVQGSIADLGNFKSIFNCSD